MASSLAQAVELLDTAVARDPKFFLAWCQLARAHDDIYWTNTDHTPARLTLAEEALAQARRLRPGAGELHLIEGLHLYHAKRDYPGALAELTLAGRALPNDADVYLYSGAVYRRSGRWEESVRDFLKSLALNPRGYVLLEELWIDYQAMRLWKETAEILRQRLELTPHDPRLRMEPCDDCHDGPCRSAACARDLGDDLGRGNPCPGGIRAVRTLRGLEYPRLRPGRSCACAHAVRRSDGGEHSLSTRVSRGTYGAAFAATKSGRSLLSKRRARKWKA